MNEMISKHMPLEEKALTTQTGIEEKKQLPQEYCEQSEHVRPCMPLF